MRVSLTLVLPAIFACSSTPNEAASSTPAPVDAGPPTVSVETCTARCVTKGESCGAPAAQAGPLCASICSVAITEAQAACLEAKSCSDLIAAGSQGATVSTICPGPEPAPGSVAIPAALTIATAIPPGYAATHTDAGEMRSSLFNVAGPPIIVPPAPGRLPKLAPHADVTVVSPPRNGCESVFNVTLTTRQLAVSTSAVDLLPDRKCSDFIDAVGAQGVTLLLRNVPWEGSEETSTVTVVLRRLASDPATSTNE